MLGESGGTPGPQHPIGTAPGVASPDEEDVMLQLKTETGQFAGVVVGFCWSFGALGWFWGLTEFGLLCVHT